MLYPTYFSRVIAYLKACCFLLFLITLVGCASINDTRVFQTNGVYIQEVYSTAGVEKVIYQFATGNKVYLTRQKNGTDADILAWVNNPQRNALEYSYSKNKIKLNSHINDFKRLNAYKKLENGTALAGSRLYSLTENGLKFERQLAYKEIKTTTKIYSKQGKLLLSGELQSAKAVSDHLFILKYADHSNLYDAQQNKTLLTATFITELASTEPLFMAYQNNKFGLIDAQGKTVVPFIYQDMMYLGHSVIALKLSEQWIIRDLKTNKDMVLAKNQIPAGKMLLGNLIPIRDQQKVAFYSLSSQQFLKVFANRFKGVPSLTQLGGISESYSFFRVAKKTGKWLLLNKKGKVALSQYITRAYHVDDFLVVTNTKGISRVFDKAGKVYSQPIRGRLSPIYRKDKTQSLVKHSSPLLKLTYKGLQGITTMRGRVLVAPKYKRITYLGQDQFLLDSGKQEKSLRIFTNSKGFAPFPAAGAEYLDGKTIIARGTNQKYGLWNILNSEWILPPEQYDLISQGKNSRFLSFQQAQGIKNIIGVMTKDGSIIASNKLSGKVHIEKNYLFNTNAQQITIYSLPDFVAVATMKGQSITLEHDHYFVVKTAKN